MGQVSMVKSDVVLDFSHPAPGQNRVQEPTESQLPTPEQTLLLTQQSHNPGNPDRTNRWHQDLPQLPPRSPIPHDATEDASAGTDIASSEKPCQETPTDWITRNQSTNAWPTQSAEGADIR
jgi:hypothetical protein